MENIRLPNKDTFKYAKQLLNDGEVVVFPTETVYGIGANALDTKALSKIFALKNRPSNNPLIIHIGDKKEIDQYGIVSNPIEKKIIEKLMPGPITILLPKKDNIPNLVSSNSFVGIRIPSNSVALDFLQYCKLPIAAPSANISTKPSPTSANMVYKYFQDNVPLIIDGGNCSVGIESTVLKVDQSVSCNPMGKENCKFSYKIVIMRPGFITKEDLEKLFSDNNNILIEYSSNLSNISPGNMYKHYAPSANIEIITDIPLELVQEKINLNKKIAFILTEQFIESNKDVLHKISDNIELISWGSREDLISCSQNLFEIYHKCDQIDIDCIFIEQLKEEGLGFSIMNRVKKSTEK